MVQNLQNSGRSSLLFFSSAWVMHLVDIGFDLILIVPLLPPSSLSLDVGYLSSVGFRTLLSVVVQYLVAILELLQEEMSTYPSTPPS